MVEAVAGADRGFDPEDVEGIAEEDLIKARKAWVTICEAIARGEEGGFGTLTAMEYLSCA